MTNPTAGDRWGLRERASLEQAEVAWDVLGEGTPVVLVHGTPSWSFIWRTIAPRLAEHHAVYLFDLIGYGDSPKTNDQDMSIGAQTRALTQLLEIWELERPALVGHDIGAAIALRTHLIEQHPASRIALIDAAVFRPWNTPATQHMKAHLNAYTTMPAHIYERVITGHLQTATYKPLPQDVLDAYLKPWRGPDGQAAYFRKIAQWQECDMAEIEDLLVGVGVPLLVLWGGKDAWLSPSIATRFEREIPTARAIVVPDGGHFLMEDQPERVVDELLAFLAG